MLNYNDLSSLPEDVFDGLSSLKTLWLQDNYLSSLPEDVFDGLSSLEVLPLSDNYLSSLPEDIFDGLSSLEVLWLDDNDLSSLPEDVFDGLSSLEGLWLYGNDLSCLPPIPLSARVDVNFLPLCSYPPLLIRATSLTVTEGGTGQSYTVALSRDPGTGNTVTVTIGNPDSGAVAVDKTTLTFTPGSGGTWGTAQTVTVRGVKDGDVTTESVTLSHKATAAGGRYMELDGPDVVVSVTDAGHGVTVTPTSMSINDGDATGSYTVVLDSEPGGTVVVAPSSGDEAVATVSGALSFNDGNWNTAQSVTVTGKAVGRAVITHAVTSATTSYPAAMRIDQVAVTVNDDDMTTVNGDDMTVDQNICQRLNALSGTICNLPNRGITSLSSGDFDGLSSLKILRLNDNDLSSLPEDVFDGLSSLETLYLQENDLSSLPEDVFDGLSSLKALRLNDNDLSSLPEDVFDGLSSLKALSLYDNDLSSLPEDVFDGLSSLETLSLYDNDLSSLPEDVFDGLSSLETLSLEENDLSSLPEDVFDGLSSLKALYLYDNDLSSLPEDVFDGLSSLEALWLNDNDLSSLPEDVFDGLSSLKALWLQENDLSSLPEDVFDGLSSLEALPLNDNDLSSLPEDVFDGLSSLESLWLDDNDLSSLPEDVFDGLSSLESLSLYDNDLSCLPPIPLSVKGYFTLPLCSAPTVNITSVAGGTEGGDVTFTLTANPAPASELRVRVTVTAAGDYGVTTRSRIVSIPTSGSFTLTLSTTDDQVDEDDGSVTLTLETDTGYKVGPLSSQTASILDNDVTIEAQQAESSEAQQQADPYAALIARVRGYVGETFNGEEHVKRWQRVLKALGEKDTAFTALTAMTATEAQTYADRGWTRWDEVVTALTALEAAAQPPAQPPVQPPVQPTISITGGSAVTEGEDVTFTLTVNPAPAANLPVTVSVSETGSFTTSGETGARTVTVGASGTVDFTVSTDDDAVDEADGSIAATVTAGTGYTVGSVATASVTVNDDDVPEVNITSVAGGTEGGDVVFTLTANPAPAASLPVSVTVTGAGDYGISTGSQTVSIPTGGSFTLTLSTTDDEVDEDDGSVTLSLETGTGYTVGPLSSQTASILDNDVTIEAQQAESSEAQQQADPYAALIARVRGYVGETFNGEEHVKRWQRVLKALGEKDTAFTALTAMTATEAQTYADRGWTRWDEVVTALTALEAAAQPPAQPPVQPPVQPTISITGGSAVTEGEDVTFTLTVNPAPAANLPVTVSVSETGSFTTSGETGARTVTVGASGTVDFTVSTDDDAVDEADGSIAATVTAGTGYTVGSVATASVTCDSE